MARGRKTGGRGKGTRNKATVERALIAERVAAETKSTGKPLAKEVLDDFMHIFAEAATRFRELGDWSGFERWALHSVDCARALAPYQSPRLSAVMVGTTAVTEIEVTGGLPDEEDGGLVNAANNGEAAFLGGHANSASGNGSAAVGDQGDK
jgi:hypothetical protein